MVTVGDLMVYLQRLPKDTEVDLILDNACGYLDLTNEDHIDFCSASHVLTFGAGNLIQKSACFNASTKV
jgi:hypothetical protein